MQKQDEFIKLTEKVAFDKETQQKVRFAVKQYEGAVVNGMKQYANLDLAKERAAYIRWKVLENLDKHLIEFESNIIRKGGKVVWASDAETACEEILHIITKRNVSRVVKSKTMMSEEIGLNVFLRGKGVTVHETDLGEYIVDLAGEAPYHSVTPAMHKSREEVASLLNDKISSSLDATAEELSDDVRNELRDKFVQSDIGITGANFLLADCGMVSITENEGNARLCTSFVKTHIVLAGIEKIVPAIGDLDTLLPILSTYGTGQQLTAYNTLMGPRQPEDEDGPTEFIVVLIDNGRSNLLAQPEQRQALTCIKCGACSNVCPVFQTIGGPAYGTAYSGPIGAVITPHLKGMEEYKHLSFASSLCGSCTNVCPVKIDLHNHLLRNRRDAVNSGLVKKSEKLMWFSWKKIVLTRKNMNKGASLKQFMLNSFFKGSWGERREFPKLADKSFNQLWREQFGHK
jgi:L-lactate dehydrogenase complex protein LldF